MESGPFGLGEKRQRKIREAEHTPRWGLWEFRRSQADRAKVGEVGVGRRDHLDRREKFRARWRKLGHPAGRD